MYLELAVGAGAAGCAAFAWLFWRIGRLALDAAGLIDADAAVVGMGVLAAVAAIAAHGLVDSFFGFTPTYVLFALTLGCASALPGLGHADRV
jgi:hypothetical protein